MAAMHHAGLQEDFYPDILRGIATYLDSGFVARVARTARRYPSPDLANALNRKQIACKKWLVDEVAETFGPDLGCVWVLGGWYGVLPALMFDDARTRVERIVNVDLDERCAPVAECLNQEDLDRGAFATRTADMLTLDYSRFAGGAGLIVNTSCEHLDRFDEWYARIPRGARLALQSNNYFSEPEHVNCVPDLAAFAAQAPLSRVRFRGELEMPNYTRFMLIGEK